MLPDHKNKMGQLTFRNTGRAIKDLTVASENMSQCWNVREAKHLCAAIVVDERNSVKCSGKII